MLRRGDGYLFESESNTAIGQLSRDTSGAGMTYGIATATSNNSKLSGEKTAKKWRYTEDAAEEEDARRLQMGNVPSLAGNSNPQDLYQSVRRALREEFPLVLTQLSNHSPKGSPYG
ncbi:UNVERIFIED_CONTAM: hypothetical protein K2H54_047291 [Gekko kuhli]